MTPWATPPGIEEEQVKGPARLETPDRARVEAERRRRRRAPRRPEPPGIGMLE
jgi:hypothetical protein